jgi:Leucine-rich repeat (LRR) protein
VSLKSLDLSYTEVSDLAPLATLLNLQKLLVCKGEEDKVAPLQNRVDCGALQVVYI